jgi:flagellar capping protein FliD
MGVMPGLDEEISKETDRILLKLINKAAKEAEKEIEKTGTLTMDRAIPLLLKSQYNHILHLDEELVTIRKIMDERFAKMDERFAKMDERFTKMDERFTKMDERFTKMDERFAKMDERFGVLSDKISEIYKWMFGCFIGTITILGSLMTFLKFFAR